LSLEQRLCPPEDSVQHRFGKATSLRILLPQQIVFYTRITEGSRSRRGTLDHLGHLRDVWVYRNDRQIKEVSYRQLEAPDAFDTVRIRELSSSPGEEGGIH
jgi:hypothetical protein